MKRFDYYKAACFTPYTQIASPKENVKTMLSLLEQAEQDIQLAVFPELAISGYSCQDLFFDTRLQQSCLEALHDFLIAMPENCAVVLGLPLQVENHLYNTAAVCWNHELLGIAVKTFIPAYQEFYETRWFSPATLLNTNEIELFGKKVPIGNDLLFEDQTTRACIGVEICEDLWSSIPVSSFQAQAGANVFCNCSASNEVVEKDSYRLDLIKNQSARLYGAYVYASAGPSESTMDLIFAGQNVIAENGTILAESSIYHFKEWITAEIDLGHLYSERAVHASSYQHPSMSFRKISYASQPIEQITLSRPVKAYPFIPSDINRRIERCQKILTLQARGLATRLEKIHCKNVVLGISGGLDSTLALLVCVKAFEICKLDPSGIHAIVMPGFGTSTRTNTNAQELARLFHTNLRIIPIKKAVEQHFVDISHDQTLHDVVYENSQARERTQILMDIANQVNGLVIGTGDLSELALGWCTYNGDHMSMYSVNSSIPKTLIRYIIESEALQAKEQGQPELERVLLDICDTPVSPELLPPDESDQISQKTEEILGSYDLHDFFLYHFMRLHERPEKIFALACLAFPNVKAKEILQAMIKFFNRFFTQQFKRNVLPDGVKVGSVSFSPRGDWRMPSDASNKIWMDELKELQKDYQDLLK